MEWDDDMPLPTEKSKIQDKLQEQVILLYGAPKIGKTTLFANFPDVFFIATEAGQKGVSVYKRDVGSWEDFLIVCKELKTEKHNFKNVAVDTIDNLVKFCSEYVCRKFEIKHESDLGFGKGFSLVNNELQRVLTKLTLMGFGVGMISHAKEKEVETRTGKIKKSVPTLSDGVKTLIMGMSDLILYADVEAEKDNEGKVINYRRVLRTKATPYYEAGGRSPRLRGMPDMIDLDYNKLLECFEGK